MPVCCLGDSLTWGYGVPRHQTWVALAAERTGLTLENHGISGDTTGGMLARLPSILARGPKAILMMGGVNDLLFGGGEGQARANLSAMIFQVAAAGVTPIVALPPDFCPAALTQDWAAAADFAAAKPLLAAYRDGLSRFCRGFGIDCLDLHQALLEGAAQPDLSDLLFDGLHPNARGHLLIAQAVSERLSALARRF